MTLRRNPPSIVLCALLLLFTVGAARSQESARNTTVQAHVVDLAGAPVEGAEVKVQPLSEGRASKADRTDSKGRARIPFLENGEYRFLVSKEGLTVHSMKITVVLPSKQVEFTAGGDVAPGHDPDAIRVGGGRTVRLEIVLGPPREGDATWVGQAASGPAGNPIGEANDLTTQKKYDESDALLTPLLAQDPGNASALYLKGLNAAGRGDTAGAGDLFGKAMQADPTLPGARAMLAQLAYQAGDKAKALELYRGEAELAPDVPSLALNVAVILDELDRKPEAVAAYEHAIALDPTQPGAYSNLAALYSELGQSEKAEETLNKLEAVGNPDPKYWFNIGADYSNSGHNEKAEAAYRKALSIDPSFPEANRELGYILLRKGDMTGARKNLQAYLTLRPDAKDAGDIRSLLNSLK